MIVGPTTDENFETTLSKVRDQKAKARLDDILLGDSKHDRTNAQHLRSVTVETYTLRHQGRLFDNLKNQYQTKILDMILDNHRKTDKYGLYLIVGIKLSQDAVVSSNKAAQSGTLVTVKAPVREAVESLGLTLLDIDPGLTLERANQEKAQKDMTAKGSRIFAIQVCVIGRPRTRNPMARLRAPEDFDLGGYPFHRDRIALSLRSSWRPSGSMDADTVDGSDNVRDRRHNIYFEDHLVSDDVVMTDL